MGARLKRTSLTEVPGLSEDIQVQLESIGITTAELLSVSLPEEILSGIGITRERALDLIRSVRQTIGTSGFKTQLEIEEKSVPLLETGFDCIDRDLGGGFRSGSIIEMQGPQWAGKTLMCSHLAIMAQLMETDDGSTPKVIWYDAEKGYRKKRIKEIAFRYRMDPEAVLRNIVLVDVKKTGTMDASLETMRRTLAKHHVSLVIIDPIGDALKYLETPSTLTGYIGNIVRLAQATGTIFVFTGITRIGFSRGVVNEYERRGSLSMMVDYELQFHLKGERERIVMTTSFHGAEDKICKLFVGDGGFFKDCASRNKDAERVQKYLTKN